MSLEDFFSASMTEKEVELKLIYLRNFKLKLNSLNLYTNERMHNLSMYLDKNENGMISLENLQDAIDGKYKPVDEEEIPDLGHTIL